MSKGNVVDWATVWLEPWKYEKCDGYKPVYKGHITSKINKKGQLRLSFSGRAVATPVYLGGITLDNIDFLIQEIKRTNKIILAKENLLNARVSRLDVKEDIKCNGILSDYISLLRELAYVNTEKNEIITFIKPLGDKESLLIKSTQKTIVNSLMVYNKSAELYANRRNDNGYYNSLDSEFLESCVDILRFEHRISGAANLRKVLHLEEKEKVTLKKVFNSKYNLVQQKIEQSFGNLIVKEEK